MYREKKNSLNSIKTQLIKNVETIILSQKNPIALQFLHFIVF